MQIQHVVHLPYLHTHRNIRIFLPPAYFTTNNYFQVLYMQDGQNVLDGKDSFGKPWAVGNFISKRAKAKQAIVVAIDHGHGSRSAEYAPFKTYRNGGGNGDAYLYSIKDHIKPLIDAEFRTMTDKQNTWLVGSSLGGLISFYGGLKMPDVFGKVVSFSPSFWYNPQVIKDFIPTSTLWDSNFYVAGSMKESYGMTETLRHTYWRLKSLGIPEERLRVVVRDKGKHNEVFWSKEFKLMYNHLI